MKKLYLILLLVMMCHGAHASQNATQLPTSSPYPGLTMLNNINSAFNTFQSNFSGASAPSTIVNYQLWVDTTTSLVKFYDGSVWQPIGKWSGGQWVSVNNGVISTIPPSSGSSNAYVVTYSPQPTAAVVGQHYPFIANFGSTGTATEYVVGIGTSAITKHGSIALVSGDITSGAVVDTVWDGSEYQIVGEPNNTPTYSSLTASGGTVKAGLTPVGTNQPGTALTLQSGVSTGNATSSINFNIYKAGSSGNTANSPTTTATLSSSGLVVDSLGVVNKINIQTFTSSGTYTPTSGMVYAVIECYGGGGGGGGVAGNGSLTNAGAGGGGGGYSADLASAATIGASQVVTIGTAGAAGSSGNNAGSNGGPTSVGTLCTAGGGGGGAGNGNNSVGGLGGTPGSGNNNILAGYGAPGYQGTGFTAATTNGLAAFGGSCAIGGGGNAIASSSGATNGNAAVGFCSGGGGGYTNNTGSTAAGGNGTAGYVKIIEYISN